MFRSSGQTVISLYVQVLLWRLTGTVDSITHPPIPKSAVKHSGERMFIMAWRHNIKDKTVKFKKNYIYQPLCNCKSVRFLFFCEIQKRFFAECLSWLYLHKRTFALKLWLIYETWELVAFVVTVCWHDAYNIPGLIKGYGGGQTFSVKQLKLWSVPHTKLFYALNL